MSYMTKQMTKKKKPNRQLERDLKIGKKQYRTRLINNIEKKEEVNAYLNCHSLDSAFERLAISQGMNSNPVFKENKECK